MPPPADFAGLARRRVQRSAQREVEARKGEGGWRVICSMAGRRPQVALNGRSEADAGTEMAIHRIIEQRAAIHGDLTAIADAGVSLSYRELNQRANAVARHLIANGF